MNNNKLLSILFNDDKLDFDSCNTNNIDNIEIQLSTEYFILDIPEKNTAAMANKELHPTTKLIFSSIDKWYSYWNNVISYELSLLSSQINILQRLSPMCESGSKPGCNKFKYKSKLSHSQAH